MNYGTHSMSKNDKELNYLHKNFQNVAWKTKLNFGSGRNKTEVIYVLHQFLNINMESFCFRKDGFHNIYPEQLRLRKGCREFNIRYSDSFIIVDFSAELQLDIVKNNDF